MRIQKICIAWLLIILVIVFPLNCLGDEPSSPPAEEEKSESTSEPSAQPTAEPTAQPSEEATSAPTEEPSARPSEEATSEPTAQPSEEATSAPSEEPSAQPSEEATVKPTAQPSAQPSSEPTWISPLFDPTAAPTMPISDETSNPAATPTPYPRIIRYSVSDSGNASNMELLRTWHGKTLLAFGDSIMHGAGAGGNGPALLFAQRYGMRVVDYSRNGAFLAEHSVRNRVQLVYGQIERAIQEQNAGSVDLIFLQGGCNDIYANIADIGIVEDSIMGVDTATIAGALEYCLILLREAYPNAEIVVLHPHNILALDNAAQIETGNILQACCEKWGARYADVYDYVSPYSSTESFCINDHPNRAQYTEYYLPCIENCLLQTCDKGWAEP